MTATYALPVEKYQVLADALSERPDRVIAVARLRQRQCRAYTLGDPAHFEAAIVQEDYAPEEPAAFGADPQSIWTLLQAIEGWTCVNVAQDVAPRLGALIQADRGGDIRYYGDIYYSLTRPLAYAPSSAVRQGIVRFLSPEDQALLDQAPEEIQDAVWRGMDLLAARGLVAAVIDSTIVAVAQIYAMSQRYADIGVLTLKSWRNRGLATDAAAVLIRRIRSDHYIPAWSTGEDNYASMKVAQKLGFTEQERRTYVIPRES